MITKVFSVYDSKAQIFNVPFFMITTPAAIRSFSDLVKDPQSMIFRHPDDYVLYEIGEYDDSNGKLINHATNHHLAIASQFKSVDNSVPLVNGVDNKLALKEM